MVAFSVDVSGMRGIAFATRNATARQKEEQKRDKGGKGDALSIPLFWVPAAAPSHPSVAALGLFVHFQIAFQPEAQKKRRKQSLLHSVSFRFFSSLH